MIPVMMRVSDRYKIWGADRYVTSYMKGGTPSNNSVLCDHLLHCHYLPSFDNFSILAHENKKYLLEIKESRLMMKDKDH